MRRIARTVAASIVIILGLALVSVASVGANTESTIGRPTAPDNETVGHIPPFRPSASRKADLQRNLNPSSFDSEFGKRGKHEVLVRLTGGPQYAITWRGDPKTEWGLGNVQRTRTIDSGFPVVQVVVNGGGRTVTCSIIVDGIEKDRQSTTTDKPIVYCEA